VMRCLWTPFDKSHRLFDVNFKDIKMHNVKTRKKNFQFSNGHRHVMLSKAAAIAVAVLSSILNGSYAATKKRVPHICAAATSWRNISSAIMPTVTPALVCCPSPFPFFRGRPPAPGTGSSSTSMSAWVSQAWRAWLPSCLPRLGARCSRRCASWAGSCLAWEPCSALWPSGWWASARRSAPPGSGRVSWSRFSGAPAAEGDPPAAPERAHVQRRHGGAGRRRGGRCVCNQISAKLWPKRHRLSKPLLDTGAARRASSTDIQGAAGAVAADKPPTTAAWARRIVWCIRRLICDPSLPPVRGGQHGSRPRLCRPCWQHGRQQFR
jgi:hypothetical protein